MILKYSSAKPTTQTTQQPKQQGGWEDVLPGAGGLVGSLIQPEGLLPGAITGGIGGGVGETARQTVRAIQGKGFDPMQILKSGGEQAAYSAIPGGEELKQLPLVGKLAENVFGRTALRAGTGYLGGDLAGLISGEKPEQAQGQGAVVGAINAISPVVGKTLGLLPKGVKQLGKTAVESAEKIFERKAQPELMAIQQLFGKEAISTAEGKAFVNPLYQKIIDKYKIPIPPNGDISAFKPALDKAAAQVEEKLQPILKDPIYSVSANTVEDVVNKNKGTFFGADRNAFKSFPIEVQKFITGSKLDLTLSELKTLQREVGKVGGSDWSQAATTPIEKWARETYTNFGQIIDSQLAKVDKAEYKDLIEQHRAIINAKDTYKGTVGSRGVLPVELTNKTLAEEKAQSQGLAGGRWLELGARSIPLTAMAAANAIPGTPDWLKATADVAGLGSAAYEGAQFLPHLNPEKALQVGGVMQNTPQVGQKLQRVLQQLGVRIPGIGQ